MVGRLFWMVKRHPIRYRIRQLEGKVCGELLNIDGSRVEGAAGFVLAAVGQLQPEVIEGSAAVELHRPVREREALGEVDAGRGLNEVGGSNYRTGGETRGYGDRPHCFRGRDEQRLALGVDRCVGGVGRGDRSIQCVIDDGSGGALDNG